MPILEQSKLTAILQSSLPGWEYSNNAIRKEFKFSNFVEAFAFMTAVALEAEKADHHPDWSNVYNTVKINLNTHSEGGVTEKDIELAKKIGKIYGK